MLSFSGFTLYFSMCFSLKGQGKNFMINIFFGAITNAASAISTTVNGVITGLAFNIITASRPNIIKNYSMNRFDEMQKTMRNCIKLSLLLFVMIVIPFYLEAPYIIQLWLGQVPMYVISFLRITLIVSCIGMINSIVTIGIDASGNIKLYSFLSGTLALIPLPIAFFLFKIGYDAEYIYVAELLAFILILIANTWILKSQIKEIKIRLLVLEILRAFLISFVSILICLIPYIYMQSSFYRVVVVSICSVITIGGLTYITLDKHQRESVNQFIFQKILRKNK
jgi:Na+-driven multidrug efflux pump